MKRTIKTSDKEYQHLLNKRNPFQLAESEKRKARIREFREREARFNENRENGIKPTPNPIFNVTNGSFFH